jgi:hypothetical protein
MSRNRENVPPHSRRSRHVIGGHFAKTVAIRSPRLFAAHPTRVERVTFALMGPCSFQLTQLPVSARSVK